MTCASARPAGTIRPGKAPGTASSIRRRAAAPKSVRRARVLRRALRHGRSELDVLRPAARRGRRARWAERTPPGFEFSVKLYQKFTHPRMFKERVRRSAAGRGARRGGAARRAGAAERRPTSTSSAAASIRSRRAGKLGALLAQFPASFKDSAGVARLPRAAARARSRDYPVAVELRHRAGATRSATRSTLLNAFGAAWVQIDEPKFRFSIRQNYLPNVQGFYYMRLHGRNADAMVAAREVRGSLQLPLLGRRAEGVHRDRRRRAARW